MAQLPLVEFGDYERDTTGFLQSPEFGEFSPPTTLTFTPSGGMTVTGAATVSDLILVIYTVPVSGGMNISGAAETAGGSSEFIPSGGVRITGVADQAYISSFVPSGGIRISGAANTGIDIIYITVSGGVSVSGEATVATDNIAFMPTGGVNISGTAPTTSTVAYLIEVSGGLAVTGVASQAATAAMVATGGVGLAGAATVTDAYPVHVPSGGLIISGAAIVVKLAANETLSPENPLNALYSGWALSYEGNAPSRYEGLPMDSICTFNGVDYISNAAGIYKLEKGTDAGRPIKASATLLSNSDFESKQNKRVPYIYFGYISEDKLRVTVQTNKHEYTYYDLQASSDKGRGARAKFGRGLDGLYWTVRISNIEGAYFELDNATIDPVILRKMGK
jgi:hypothetical protein